MKDEEHPLNQQLEKAERIAYLIAGFLQHTLTPAEHDELDAWVVASPQNMQLFEDLTDEGKNARQLQQFREADTAAGLKRLHQKISESETAGNVSKIGQAGKSSEGTMINHGTKSNEHATGSREAIINTDIKPAQKSRRISRRWLIGAAAAVVLAAVGLLLFFNSKKSNTLRAGGTASSSTSTASSASAAAGSQPYRAYLHTESGDSIALDEAADGNLSVQGNTQVVKQGGLLSYHQTGRFGISERTVQNTLSTQRGGQYALVLPDGTKAWLNAASSLSFPTAFTGRERKVVLTGEAYFEVAKDAARPFVVWAGNTRIEALGTRFTINAYGDEATVSAALVEGSLRVIQGTAARVLRPGEEAQVTQGTITVQTANLARATGWHEGHLTFSNTPLSTIANELSRWFDTDIIYRGHNQLHLTISINRNLTLDKVIHLLEATNNVHFVRLDSGGWEIQ